MKENNETLEVSKKALREAYKDADKSLKAALVKLFGEENCNILVPSLDNYKSIKTYEDACEALGENPIDETELESVDEHIIAFMKLETISKALWGRTFKPHADPTGSKWYYYPWFALYTEREIKELDDKDKASGALLSAYATTGTLAGFGYLSTNYRASYAWTDTALRLCQENEEKARYFGTQFIELWAVYLRFGFTTGERIF